MFDHPALNRARKECEEILFVYVFDDRIWRTQGKNPRMGHFRARFLLEALEELKNKIDDLGGQIEFLFGRASEEIPKLAEEYGARHCFAQREACMLAWLHGRYACLHGRMVAWSHGRMVACMHVHMHVCMYAWPHV